jgi:ubiquinone/menaquinone biosynthesis C-methylase UbiE
MTSPFDAIAPHYAKLWSESTAGHAQRAEVWQVIDRLFRPGQHILDLGCGIGDDALHLASLGIRTSAFDAAQQMVAIAQARGVDAKCLSIESLSQLSGTYDGALSNFSAFDCVKKVPGAARELSRLLRPGGVFALCVFSRFHVSDWRRWSGRATWRGIDVYYRSRREWVAAMRPHFSLLRRTPIGGGDHQLYVFERRPQ